MAGRPFKRYPKPRSDLDSYVSLLDLQTSNAVKHYITNPTTDNFKAAIAALERHVIQHDRWIAPKLLTQQERNNIMNNNQHNITGFYRNPQGAYQSIASAMVTGEVKRSVEEGKVVINGMTMPAEAAIAAGMIDQEAADHIAKVEGTDKPAPFTREDHVEPEELTKTPTEAVLEALGKCLINPTALTVSVAKNALEAHLLTTGGIA
jgi:hypothetical protein